MTVPVGGKRARFVYESLWYEIRRPLELMGWFTASTQHEAFRYSLGPIEPTESAAGNTISCQPDARVTRDWELGSNLAEHDRSFYVDVMADTRSVGLHIVEDIHDILEGRYPEYGRSRPIIPIRDWVLLDANAVVLGTGGLPDPAGNVTLGTDTTLDNNVYLGAGEIFAHAQVDAVRSDALIEDPSIKYRAQYWTIRIDLLDYYGDSTDERVTE